MLLVLLLAALVLLLIGYRSEAFEDSPQHGTARGEFKYETSRLGAQGIDPARLASVLDSTEVNYPLADRQVQVSFQVLRNWLQALPSAAAPAKPTTTTTVAYGQAEVSALGRAVVARINSCTPLNLYLVDVRSAAKSVDATQNAFYSLRLATFSRKYNFSRELAAELVVPAGGSAMYIASLAPTTDASDAGMPFIEAVAGWVDRGPGGVPEDEYGLVSASYAG